MFAKVALIAKFKTKKYQNKKTVLGQDDPLLSSGRLSRLIGGRRA